MAVPKGANADGVSGGRGRCFRAKGGVEGGRRVGIVIAGDYNGKAPRPEKSNYGTLEEFAACER